MAKSLKKTIVEIFGSQYTISGDMEEDYIRHLADYVHERMSELSKALPSAKEKQLAVLTALNIADELFQAEEELKPKDEIPPLYVEKTRKLIMLLDKGLIGEDGKIN
ncbi:MAG: cell division protein ZapA [Leptospiraceae bacterium]|nr:cell division protein ZapA [Leptospiraceae bacterium]MCP5498397.1 cell division protein ZapA [Leptospiraceae bacterium]